MKRQYGMRRDFQEKVVLHMAMEEFRQGLPLLAIDYAVKHNLRRPGGNSRDRRRAARSWRKRVRLSPQYKAATHD